MRFSSKCALSKTRTLIARRRPSASQQRRRRTGDGGRPRRRGPALRRLTWWSSAARTPAPPVAATTGAAPAAAAALMRRARRADGNHAHACDLFHGAPRYADVVLPGVDADGKPVLWYGQLVALARIPVRVAPAAPVDRAPAGPPILGSGAPAPGRPILGGGAPASDQPVFGVGAPASVRPVLGGAKPSPAFGSSALARPPFSFFALARPVASVAAALGGLAQSARGGAALGRPALGGLAQPPVRASSVKVSPRRRPRGFARLVRRRHSCPPRPVLREGPVGRAGRPPERRAHSHGELPADAARHPNGVVGSSRAAAAPHQRRAHSGLRPARCTGCGRAAGRLCQRLAGPAHAGRRVPAPDDAVDH